MFNTCNTASQADEPLLSFPFRVVRADFVSQETENVRSEQKKGWQGKEEDMKRSSTLKLFLKKITGKKCKIRTFI